MNNINRKKTNKRMSQIVVHNDTIYLAGLPGEGGLLLASDRETWEMLRKPIKEALDTLR